MEHFPEKNPNPVLCVAKDGTVIYSNEAAKPLLIEWGAKVGEKLPSNIVDLVQRVVARNIPEKLEFKAGNRVFLISLHHLPEECVNINGFDISDYKELEEKLRESENKYRNIVETSAEGIWVFNEFSETTYVNEKMSEMLGYNREEMIGRFIWDFAYEEDKGIFQVRLENRKQGKDEVYELKLLRKDGLPLWISVSAKGFFDDAGKFKGSVAMFTDITERKQAEEALKKAHDTLEEKVKERTAELEQAYNSLEESRKSLAEAQEMAHIGNWEWDIKTDKAYWSEEMYRIFKRDPQKSPPSLKEYYGYIHPDDLDYYCKATDNTRKVSTSGFDFRIVLAKGEERTLHLKSDFIYNDENIPIRVKGIVQDITESKNAEEEIRYLASIVESSPDAIGTISLDGIITSWNKGAERVYGYSAEEILGKHVSILSPFHLKNETMNEIKKLIELIKQGESYYHYETLRLGKNGKEIYVSVTYSPIFDNNGKLTAISIIGRDITERKRAEEALKNFEIAQKKEIHHRIKNNLQVISSLLDLQADKFNDSKVIEAFRESQNRVISMSLIHEELYKEKGTNALDFSEYIKTLAENLFKTYRLSSKDIHICTDLEKSTFFHIDTAIPLGMVVNELVTNSFKYAFQGRDTGEIRINLHREEGSDTSFILTVSDDGVGIPANIDIEELDSLGLQLVTTLVDQLDGELELKRDNGTEFIVRFKITEKDNQASAPASRLV